MAKTKTKTRPQVYPRLSFHLVRTIAFISAAVATGILTYFCIQLGHDGFKLPWTFIILLLATLLSLISLLTTTVVYACFFLSPLCNLVVNLGIATVWTVGLALLTWNMYGTLGHSCSRANWASDDGMMVCRTYKALYSFGLFGWLAQLALVVLDVRSRRAQTALGRYDRMAAPGGGKNENINVKMHTLDHNTNLVNRGQGHSDDNYYSHASSQGQEVPYGVGVPDRQHGGSDRPRGDGRDKYAAQPRQQPPWQLNSRLTQSQPTPRGRGRMEDFRAINDYERLPPHTAYGNGGYGYEPQR